MTRNITTFNTRSDDYRRHRPVYPEKLYENLYAVGTGFDRAWDCGCGNGQVAAVLAERFASVIASDISENQLAHAVRAPNIDYRCEGVVDTGIGNASVDLICAAQSLHWFDLDRYFDEIRRVAKPGAVFAFWGYGFFSIDGALDEIIGKLLLQPIDRFWAPGNRMVINRYRDLTVPFRRLKFPPVAMVVEWDLDELIGYYGTWSAVKLYQEREDSGVLDLLRKELERYWPPGERKSIDMNLTVYVYRVKE